MEPAAAEAVAVGGGRLLPQLLPLMLPLLLLVGAAAVVAALFPAACEAAAAAAFEGEFESEVDELPAMVLGLRLARAVKAAAPCSAGPPKGGEGADVEAEPRSLRAVEPSERSLFWLLLALLRPLLLVDPFRLRLLLLVVPGGCWATWDMTPLLLPLLPLLMLSSVVGGVFRGRSPRGCSGGVVSNGKIAVQDGKRRCGRRGGKGGGEKAEYGGRTTTAQREAVR